MGDVYGMEGEDYFVELQPFGPEDDDWVQLPHSWTMWADPNRHGGRNYMFEWGDPGDGGICGELDDYESRPGLEVHNDSSGFPGIGTEKHCIRPGVYTIRLRKGSVAGEVRKEFKIDYLGGSTVTGSQLEVHDSTSGKKQVLNEMRDEPHVFDFIVHFDLTGETFTSTPNLDLENAGNNELRTWFKNQGTLSGSETDHFRASVARSESSWDRHDKGEFLAKLYWDTARPSLALETNYYNPQHLDHWMLRTFQYGDHIKTSRTINVGMGILRPDQLVSDNILDSRPLSFVRTGPAAPVADIHLQGTPTWRSTDQLFTVGDSDRGANYRYSWSFDGGASWSPETTDTIVEFLGHSSAGFQSARLKVREISTNQTTQTLQSIEVINNVVSLTGTQSIPVKTSYTYNSNVSGEWFERQGATPPPGRGRG